MANNLFAKKPLALLLEEMKGENRLRRVLGPVTLTSLGVGAIIGTGIFVLTGVAAHDKAVPDLFSLLRLPESPASSPRCATLNSLRWRRLRVLHIPMRIQRSVNFLRG